MSKNKLERRYFDVSELRAESQDGAGTQLSGYAAVFDTMSVDLGSFRETIAKGAFSDSLTGDIRALWNHDSNIVLGRTKSGTLRVAEDAKGLRVEIDPPASAAGVVESIQRGDVDQMSFGFRTISDEWENDDNGQTTRTLLKAELIEVSPVTFPAYSATEVGVRSEIYGYIPDVPDHLQKEGSAIDKQDQAQKRRENQTNKLDVMEQQGEI